MKKNQFYILAILLLVFIVAGSSCKKKESQAVDEDNAPEASSVTDAEIVSGISSITDEPGSTPALVESSAVNPTRPPIIVKTSPPDSDQENPLSIFDNMKKNLTRTPQPGNQGQDKMVDRQPARTFKLERAEEDNVKIFLDKEGNNYDFLLLKIDALQPLDYRIGLLQDLIDTDVETQNLLDRLKTFLDALIAGKIEKDLLDETSSSSVSSYLDYNIIKQKNIPVKYRIGAVTVKDLESQINIRLFSDIGATEGEIYMIKRGGFWFVSDFQINLDLLKIKYNQADDNFIPSSYYWMLKEK